MKAKKLNSMLQLTNCMKSKTLEGSLLAYTIEVDSNSKEKFKGHIRRMVKYYYGP